MGCFRKDVAWVRWLCKLSHRASKAFVERESGWHSAVSTTLTFHRRATLCRLHAQEQHPDDEVIPVQVQRLLWSARADCPSS